MDKNSPQGISVIITTYNQPRQLELVLIGFEYQSNNSFEILIADDGSGEETKKVIDKFKSKNNYPIRHVWHEDTGFRKCTILNKAILEATYNYLLFTDGDCIPRFDFIDVHLKKAKKGHFLSGGYFKLNKKVTDQIVEQDIIDQNPFNISWLREKGQDFTYKFLKFTRCKWMVKFLNRFTTTKPTWNGHNVSGWKDDIIAVNGYNEDMMYGGLDRELGERLENYGVKGLQIRYSAIVIHLDHPRPYKKKHLVEKNRNIRREVEEMKITFTPNGLDKYVTG